MAKSNDTLGTIGKTVSKKQTRSVTFSIRMSEKLRALVIEKADNQDRTPNQLINMLICQGLGVDYKDYKI